MLVSHLPSPPEIQNFHKIKELSFIYKKIGLRYKKKPKVTTDFANNLFPKIIC